MSEPVLELVDVRAAYGRIEVLRGVSFAVPKGSVVALLGPNGGGKSTTIKVISGALAATDGHVHLAGKHVNGRSPEELSRIGLCTIPEGRGIFPNLTVEENLRLFGLAGAADSDIRDRSYTTFPRLAERRRQMAGHLSGGEQQMLALARALSTDPGVLLLDELSMGLAPLIVEELYGIVADIASTGISVLVVEQFARTALAVAEFGVVMVHGQVTAIGQPADIEQELSKAYLGDAA